MINSVILDSLQGLDVRDQKNIDNILLKLDGTKNKSRLGANTILSVSLAVAKTASKNQNIELYNYLGGLNTNLDLLEASKSLRSSGARLVHQVALLL